MADRVSKLPRGKKRYQAVGKFSVAEAILYYSLYLYCRVPGLSLVLWSWPYGEVSGWVVAGLLQWSLFVLLAFGVRGIIGSVWPSRNIPTAER